ncbi:hypothetical protein ACIA5A_00070 [Micromonospora sp. NPDC051300]|uniref:hypothetical protein n=1 Tax=Micromonospora sp. NPDC051300 TaxID=3364286 RepID=UPI0037A7B5D7
MIRFLRPVSESTTGVRQAREMLPELLSSVASGNRMIHVTRRGERVAAIVSPDVAQKLLMVVGEGGPAIPGDLAGAITLIEMLLEEDEQRRPDVSSLRAERHELTGAFITLVDIMLPHAILDGGRLRVTDDNGEVVETKLVANILVRRLYGNPDIQDFPLDCLPVVAGSIWAAQNGTAIGHRLQIPIEVSPVETVVWAFAAYELCRIINLIHGSGTAEALMYAVEESSHVDLKGTGTDPGDWGFWSPRQRWVFGDGPRPGD